MVDARALNNFPRDHTGALVDSIDSISKLVFYDDDTSSRRNISEYELFVDFLSVYLVMVIDDGDDMPHSSFVCLLLIFRLFSILNLLLSN